MFYQNDDYQLVVYFIHQESVEDVATEAVMLDKLTFRMPANIIKDLKEANPNKLTGNDNEAALFGI